jgi:hypothetical protein
MKDNWKPKPAFIASLPGINYKSNKYLSQVDDEAVFTNHVDQDQQKVHINAEEILPTLNWSEISTRISSKKNAIVDFNDIENVDARLFLLENNLAVLLDSSEGSRATIINITDDIKTERINVDEIEIGMFILLRTQGGGEYILSIANQILGNKANYCREIQKHWKDLLRAYLRDHSTEYAISELRNLGSTRASKTNINNWLSYRSIKTEDFSDFNAIMRLINLKNESQEYWETMCMIDKAHLMAGQSIRKLLLRQIRQSNLNDLIQKDKIEFELPEAQGGSLTAFRITDIAPETITVPISRLQVLFEVDGL